MRNRQIRSALDGVVLILSALLFTLLSLVSCKNELKPTSAPAPPPPVGRNATMQPAVPPMSIVAPQEVPAPKVEYGVEGGVVGGVVGGVAGGMIGTSYAANFKAANAMREDSQFNTEEYGRIDENGFLAVADNPLSTFSVDVDRASYANVRRFLNQGTLPPKDAVRIEELLNYFRYDYPEPEGKDRFSVTTDLAVAPWAPEHRLRTPPARPPARATPTRSPRPRWPRPPPRSAPPASRSP